MSDSFKMSFEPTRDKATLRKQLQAERLAMADRHQRAVHLQEVLRARAGLLPAELAWQRLYEGAQLGRDSARTLQEETRRMPLVPCVGFGPKGLRLGYGGGFYDRTLAALRPRPFTVGVGFAHGYVPWLKGEPHDVPLDAMLVEDGVAHFGERDR